MSGNMVHTGRDLVPPLLRLGTVIITGVYIIKERRKQLELNEKTKSERQELEAKLRTAQIQLNAAKTQIKSLEADARKRQVAEGRAAEGHSISAPCLASSRGDPGRQGLKPNQIILLVLFLAGVSTTSVFRTMDRIASDGRRDPAAKGWKLNQIILLVLFLAGRRAAQGLNIHSKSPLRWRVSITLNNMLTTSKHDRNYRFGHKLVTTEPRMEISGSENLELA
ncbi:MAG: hypothetical protein L6R39_007063 [Caloplaca ligustica]|nr:MAG: hypothetical protein L6R39_007063 [Caloplaca ligustica]